MPSGGADLLFDQVEVIEQPFPGRCNPAVCLDRLGQQVPDAKQDLFVLSQPRQQQIRGASRTQWVRTRQVLAVLFHLIGAEQLRSQRWLVTGVISPKAPSRKARLQAEQRLTDRMTAHVHCYYDS